MPEATNSTSQNLICGEREAFINEGNKNCLVLLGSSDGKIVEQLERSIYSMTDKNFPSEAFLSI